jgi:hypothetical protein
MNGENESSFLFFSNCLPGFLPLLLLLLTLTANKIWKRHMLFTKTFLLLTTSGLSENDFNSAEPQDYQAAFFQAKLPTQRDPPIQFGDSYSNHRWRIR